MTTAVRNLSRSDCGQCPYPPARTKEKLLKTARVLLADDHVVLLERVRRLLESSYDVVAAVSDGEAALEAVESLSPDVAVLDISMPGLTGIEVARRLKECRSRTRVVFLTVHDDRDFLLESLEAGGYGYVVKSCMASELETAIDKALAGRNFVSSGVQPYES